ncbi:Strong similarity to a putative non-LTR retroelement reverse transcriptase At2g23880 gi/3738337 from Arabidopsis thaliana BAC F27L4 gb/AC005170 [Arabidopsis thaliana]|uniref:F5D14.16 protein n=1 Tax=Arabidopsis thaliana TaxID=3702 RepID=Q9LQL9_ARATH|nr:Strong similarity to a putative non-LTR retroelement reverse transcriptase At2g23880 gi/3738337 from Arabidopsis thaliana BAC F27L4 gb/AC005170 [Arabidopsis thaliana]
MKLQRSCYVRILNEFEEILLQKYQQRNIEREEAILWRGKADVFKATFSTKDTWNHIRTSSNQRAWHTGVWFAHATPKFSFCAWLAVRNRLSMVDRMMTWNNGTPTTCVFCSSPMETRDHLFFQCHYSSEIWTSIAKNVYKDGFSTDWSAVVHIPSLHSFNHGEASRSASNLMRQIDKTIRNQLSTIQKKGELRLEKGLQVWFAMRP